MARGTPWPRRAHSMDGWPRSMEENGPDFNAAGQLPRAASVGDAASELFRGPRDVVGVLRDRRPHYADYIRRTTCRSPPCQSAISSTRMSPTLKVLNGCPHTHGGCDWLRACIGAWQCAWPGFEGGAGVHPLRRRRFTALLLRRGFRGGQIADRAAVWSGQEGCPDKIWR